MPPDWPNTASAAVQIRTMIAEDVVSIERQASQRVQLGIERIPSIEEAHALLDEGEAWSAVADDGRVVACMGIRETFPGRQGVAWAILAGGVGAAHLAITRHARARIAASPLVRIEAIVRLAVDAECQWARLVGLEARTILRKFGAASEDHVLFERIR